MLVEVTVAVVVIVVAVIVICSTNIRKVIKGIYIYIHIIHTCCCCCHLVTMDASSQYFTVPPRVHMGSTGLHMDSSAVLCRSRDC